MRAVGKFLFWFVVILFASLIVLAGYSYVRNEELARLNPVVSPLPDIFGFFSKEVEGSEFWQPNLENDVSSEKIENLTALSVISYDISTDKLLYEKNSNKRMPMASLTKIMTAIVTLENLDLTEKVTVTKSAAEIGEGTMGLSVGETLTIEELLYGLLLQSGNDAGETIAQTSEYGKAGFIHLMNKKAEDIGLSNTRFTNPTGLEGDGLQYTTARELVVLTKYAMKYPKFREIVSTYQHDIPATVEHKSFTLFNETNLLTTYPGVKGVKTGYTDEAGLCLVTYLEYEGHEIIAVLLNSQNRRAEMAQLLDFSLKKLGIKPPARN